MKSSRLTVGILLMILGVGITACSVYRHYENGRYGVMNRNNKKIVTRRGMMGGFNGPKQRRFNVNPNPVQPPNPKLNPNQGQTPNNIAPNQNQNQSQNSNGGVSQ